MSKSMTKLDLEVAQFALMTSRIAQHLADKVDPKRKRVDDAARHLDAIAKNARFIYFSLTGRWPEKRDTLVALNTDHPAGWTRNVEQCR